MNFLPAQADAGRLQVAGMRWNCQRCARCRPGACRWAMRPEYPLAQPGEPVPAAVQPSHVQTLAPFHADCAGGSHQIKARFAAEQRLPSAGARSGCRCWVKYTCFYQNEELLPRRATPELPYGCPWKGAMSLVAEWTSAGYRRFLVPVSRAAAAFSLRAQV